MRAHLLVVVCLAAWLTCSASAAAQGNIVLESVETSAHISGAGGYDEVLDETTRRSFVQVAGDDPLAPFSADGNAANQGVDGDKSWSFDLDTTATSDVDVVNGALSVDASGFEGELLQVSGGGYAVSDGAGLGTVPNWIEVRFEVPGTAAVPFSLTGTVTRSFAFSGNVIGGCGNAAFTWLQRLEGGMVVNKDGPTNGTTTVDTSGFLIPGHYRFLAMIEVSGNARAGTGSVDCTGSYDLSLNVDPALDCTTSTDGVRVGNALACGLTLNPVETGSKVYSTSNTAWVGGFEVRPRPAGKLVVDTELNELRSEGAGVDVMFAGVAMPVPLAAIPINQTAGEIELGGPGTLESNLFDLPLKGKAKVEWADNGSAATFAIEVDVQKLVGEWGTPADPGTSATLDGSGAKLSARLQNGKGFVLENAEVKASEIAVVPRVLQIQRTLSLKDLVLKYALVDGKHTFSGQVGFTLPFLKGEIVGVGRGAVYDGSFASGGLSLSGFNRPIPGAAALFLKSVEGDLQFIPSFGFNLGIAATVGPQVAGTELTEITANARGYALASGCTTGQDPIELALVAKVTPVEQAGLGKATLSGTACVYVSSEVLEGRFAAEAALGGGLFPELMGFSGNVVGWISSSAANYEGTGTVRLPGLPDVTGSEILSTKGIGACARFSSFFEGGFAYAWGGAAPTAFTGCDLAPWRETVQASASIANRVTARVLRRVPFAGFSVASAARPPRVRVTGPRGERFSSPAAGNVLSKRDVYIAHIPTENRTYVFVRKPSRGRWRIESDSPLNGLRTADGLAKPKVRAKVRGKRRAPKRVLRYRIRRMRGQRVEFFERVDGQAQRLGKPTSRRRGRIRFKPLVSADATHVVEATVTQNRLPRERMRVARFRVAAPG